MSEIRIVPPCDVEKLYELRKDTYPSIIIHIMNEPREKGLAKLRELQKMDGVYCLGYYSGDSLYGSMRLFDFKMNLYEQEVLVGGIGSISVDLLHKKEKIAKELVEYFFQFYQDKGAGFVFLYAFRPDFYKKMGFGYGTRAYEYRVVPSSFPKGSSKRHLVFASEDDIDKLLTCYNREMKKTHGMIRKTECISRLIQRIKIKRL